MGGQGSLDAHKGRAWREGEGDEGKGKLTLAVPEGRLAVAALVTGQVRAALGVDPGVGIDGVPGEGLDHGAWGREARASAPLISPMVALVLRLSYY